MRTPKATHGNYWLLPTIAFLFWTATLLTLLLVWTVKDDARMYQVDETKVVFISDVGAAHRAIFIPGTAVTFVFYTLSLVAERWLRHVRRLPGALKKSERILDVFAVIFGTIGGAALMLLSIFNAFDYSTLHWIFTAIFVVGVAISAVCQTAEVMSLERDHVERKHLRRNAIWKLCIVSFAVAGAIVFGGTYGACASQPNDAPVTGNCIIIESVAASFEWFIAFLYDVYLFTLILDLWPARKTVGHHFRPELVEQDKANVLHAHADGRPGQPGGLPLPTGVDRGINVTREPNTMHERTSDDGTYVAAEKPRKKGLFGLGDKRSTANEPEMSQV